MENPEYESIFGFLTEDIHIAGDIFSMFGVGIMIAGIAIATVLFFKDCYHKKSILDSIQDYKIRIGRALLLSLEVLIAADIVKTVALTPTVNDLAALGLIVVIRVFLSWALTLEIEGHWPWQNSSKASHQE
jgi:uncharacterized membrane protein